MRVQRVEDGEVRRKVDCQACGYPKVEGEVCEAELGAGKVCGWPQLQLERTDSGRLLIFLPLCPSTNARMMPVRMGRTARDVETPEARDYIASVSAQLEPLLKKATELWGWRPITRYEAIDLWVILPRTNCDAHNYGKVLFDALEAGGLTWNDKYLLPRYCGVWHDAKEPAVVVRA